MNVRHLASRVDAGGEAHLRERPRPDAPARPASDAGFAAHLEQAATGARISGHAWQRIRQRGISMTDAQQRRLGQAMQALDAKGAREALLMRADAAFVVNVPNRTVVTALDRHEMHHRVFTGIDSAVLLDAPATEHLL